MTANILSGIVHIRNKRIGTGFVVSADGLILTCSHVLGTSRPEKVLVVFQVDGEQREATVLAEGWRTVDAEDVALLRVSGALSTGVQPLPFGSSWGTEGHPLVTFGYPDTGEVEGVRGTGTILGHGAKTSAGQPLLQLRSSEITEGFSGAPVWDEVRRRVVGMVVIAAQTDALGKLGETAFATPTETLRAISPALQIIDICPYRNLEAFTEADAMFFRGRQRVIELLVDNLQNEPRFLAVFGASGSGKSSVVQAGLIPRLRKGALPGSDRWEIIVTRPTDTFFKQHLANLDQAPAPVAIVIDQFEELFVSYDETASLEVITQLRHLLEHSPHVTLLIVMRDDFYSVLVRQEMLAMWLKSRVVNVWSTLKRGEVESIVREPAELMGWRFEEGLIETIVNDVLETSEKGHQKDGSSTILPLLEFTLTQLWERHQDGILTHEAHRRIGGIAGGLRQWANNAYYTFEETLRPLVRRIFTDLVHLDDEEQHIADSRRRRALSSLIHTETERADIYQIVRRLVTARLLVTSQDTESNQEMVEIIHDALLWEWELLKRWVEEDRRFLTWHQELERPVHGWTTQRDKSKLLRGRDLTEAERWLKERRADLNQDEVAFLRASATQHMRFVVSVIAVFLLLVLSTGIAGWALVHQPPPPLDHTHVTNLHDAGVGSLRWAIETAPAESKITFDSHLYGTIWLTSSDLAIGKPLKIQGPGANVLAISSGSRGYRVDIAVGIVVSISGLTLNNSKKLPSSFINNGGSLTLIDSVVSGNVGGIFNDGGKLTLVHTVVSDNAASSEGAGIFNSNGAVNLIDSTIADNVATSDGDTPSRGGGIDNIGGTVNLVNSTVTGNSSTGDGGGIFNFGTLILSRSTVSGNTTSSNGGGIANYSDKNVLSSTLTLSNSTISENTASGSNSRGGGIFNNVGSRTNITFCTIYDNTASHGGGVFIENSSTDKSVSNQVQMRNSIIAGNHAQSSQDIVGPLTSYGHNLIQDISDATFVQNDQHSSDLVVDVHADLKINPKLTGGPPQTHALLLGSPAIDKIPLNACHVNGIFTDQRGVRRPQGTACDIGAYEYTATPSSAIDDEGVTISYLDLLLFSRSLYVIDMF